MSIVSGAGTKRGTAMLSRVTAVFLCVSAQLLTSQAWLGARYPQATCVSPRHQEASGPWSQQQRRNDGIDIDDSDSNARSAFGTKDYCDGTVSMQGAVTFLRMNTRGTKAGRTSDRQCVNTSQPGNIFCCPALATTPYWT